MLLISWIKTPTSRAVRRGAKRQQTFRPQFEQLERREVFSAASPHVLDVGPTAIYHTIQAAVDAARPGDKIKIATGIYQESVIVSKPHLTLEGAPHSNVVIQNPTPGTTTSLHNGIVVTADPAAPISEMIIPAATLDEFKLSNVTVTGFEHDGVRLIGVKHFNISHVTATDNGEYGIFPIFSSHGVIANSTASGSNDTGIYVGQSREVQIVKNTVFDNLNGIEIENSSQVIAAGNLAYDNTVGIADVLLPGLAIEASSHNEISDNRVLHNNRSNTAPPDDIVSAEPPGVGIAIVGGDHTLVTHNVVTGNVSFGIAVLGLIDLVHPLPFPYPANIDPNPNFILITHNAVTGNGIDLFWTGTGKHNRWVRNAFNTSNVPLPG